ncbi:MAG TPA: CocE/NonD family hydrolase [Acidimicrobiales bacterium]|nr:CocE/NonD family hydrolase [Acidimicrobiales bacterium]
MALSCSVLAAGTLTWAAGGGYDLAAAKAPACAQNTDQFPGEVESAYNCQYTYATMADGTAISVVVSYPAGYSGGKLPALFMMDGYDGGGGSLDPNTYGNRYVMVHASVRGTGCSSGTLDLFSWQDAEDGADIVNSWIPAQPWANGRVGIIGHSYPGLTGFMTAERIGFDESLHPASSNHLDAVSVSGLIDDLYRGITYMGGIPDDGFPVLWTGAVRPESELQGNAQRYGAEASTGDTACLGNIATRPASDALAPDAATDDAIVNGVTQEQDTSWWWAHSLITQARYINEPIHIDQQYQDEQTGPRGGAELFQALENLAPSLPKRIVLGNGRHDSTGHVYHPDEENWLDCYVAQLAGACAKVGASSLVANANGPGSTAPSTDTTPSTAMLGAATHIPCPGDSVVAYFESTPAVTDAANNLVSNGTKPPLCSTSFPLPGTQWTNYFLNADGSMSTTQGATGQRSYLSAAIGPDDYVGPTEVSQVDSTTDTLYGAAVGPVLSSSAPDELTYALPFTTATTLEGPIMADLYASVAGINTDFFVQLIDRDEATGAEQFLQYGLLRADYVSTFDPTLSDYAAGGTLYRPYYAFTNPAPLSPGAVNEYRIEVFPLGWVFRPGHQLLVTVSAPPAIDQLYGWGGEENPATLNTVLADAAHPSRLLLPLLPAADNPLVGAAEPCGSLEGVRCTTPATTATASGLR